jgi:hypothetical protein
MKFLILVCAGLAAIVSLLHQPGVIAGTQTTKQPQSETIFGIADRQIVPGKRVGAIVKTTSYQDLVKLFGIKKLKNSEYYGPEGQVNLPATIVTFSKNKQLKVVWKDRKRDRIFMTIVADSDWRTNSGIHVGMSLPQLRKIVGKFKVSGLGWDYGNSVNFPDRQTYPLVGLGIKVDADEKAMAKFPNDYQAVSGDGLDLADDDSRWKNLNMRVTYLEIFYQ